MAKQTKKKTAAKKPLHHRLRTYNFFLILAIVLGMIAGILMVRMFYRGEPMGSAQVNLGAISYDLSGGKAVKRDDPKLDLLQAYLEKQAAKDCRAVHSFMEPSLYSAIAATPDLTQVLLGYGCGDVSARMFAVYKDNAWQTISPTNHFDAVQNAPECGYLKKHAIKRDIAPVCYREAGSGVTYHTR